MASVQGHSTSFTVDLERREEIRIMQEKSLKTLEFDRILERLSELASSAPGKERCLRLRPKTQALEVEQALSETEDSQQEIEKNGSLPLAAFDDLTELCQMMTAGSVPAPGAFLRVARQLRLVQRLKARLSESAEEVQSSLCLQRISQLDAHADLEREIDRCILNEEELKDRASPELYRLRRSIQQFQEDVKNQLEKLVRAQGGALQDQVITLRDDRYVLPVKASHRTLVPGIVHDASASGATVFVEPMVVVELNNKIREARAQEKREVERILMTLAGLVSLKTRSLLGNQELLTCLDFAQAKAKLAIQLKALRPQMNQEGRLKYNQARHPLIPASSVVPIDFELGITFKTLVITGPNTGGKTVSLKTAGLLTLMAMSGLLIPVEAGSESAIFQEVFADIGDEQSIEQNLSTFSSHMRQITSIVEQASPGTLVLTDELGAGTDPTEGAALAIAILDYLKDKGCETVATTHYQEIKAYALNTDQVCNASCEFDVNTLAPTYRLMIGVPGVSNALAISKRLGLKEEILEKAQCLVSDEGVQFEELVRSIERSQQEAQQMRDEIAELKRATEQTKRQLEEEKKRLREEKKTLVNEARQEASQILHEAQEKAEEALKTIREIGFKDQQAGEEAKIRLSQLEERLSDEMTQAEIGAQGLKKVTADSIQVGQIYRDLRSGFTGSVLELPDNRNEVVLQNGSMKIRVNLTGLIPVSTKDWEASKKGKDKATQRKRSLARNSAPLSAATEMRSELYLLGKRADEAVHELDQYITQAASIGFNVIRIVHGKGTGALRKAVREKLDGDPRIRDYQDAAFGEGDAGVTVARLK